MLTTLIELGLFAAAAVASPVANEERQLLNSPYAPSRGRCPAGTENFVRPASGGLNPDEAAWVAGRKPIATAALKKWLAKRGAFPALTQDQYPTIGMVDGGGGFRGFLISAGFHKAFDINEGELYDTSGLYQTFTYETGLSGSSLNVMTHAFNNWPTVTELTPQWTEALNNGVDNPDGGKAMTKLAIQNDVRSKQFSGYPSTLVDAWARDLSWVTSPASNNHGISLKFSDLPNYSGFNTFANPMPIVTALGIEEGRDGCGLPPRNASQYEFTPYEFGSWEAPIGNFMTSKYLGTQMRNGRPITSTCVTGFDNVGWVMATSTNTFNQNCGPARARVGSLFGPDAFQRFKLGFQNFLGNSIETLYAVVPNPFYQLASAPLVRDQNNLRLVDGGESIQVPPIWPYLYRPNVDVLIISDNSADGPSNYESNGTRVNFPSGQQIFNTYTQALENNIESRMPYIPPPGVFVANDLNKKPMTFFGCNLDPFSPAMLFIYLPNRAVSFDSNQDAPRLQYDPASTAGMIQNGVDIATNAGDPEFATCMGCAIMKKAAGKAKKNLPAACTACFKKYCWALRQ